MGSFSLNYLLRRLLVFFLTVWVAATLIFIIPRLAPGDPIGAMIARMSQQEGYVENANLIIEAWRKRFGLDDPIHLQYLRFLGNTLRLDLGYSLANFPATVAELVSRALPWTIGLVGIATAIFLHCGQPLRRLAGMEANAEAAENHDSHFDDFHLGAARAIQFAAGVYLRVPAAHIPASRGLWPRHGARVDARIYRQRALSRLPARHVNRAGDLRLLGAGHARHDGDH